MMSRYILLLLLLMVCAAARAQDITVKWIHGSEPCSANRDPAFQVHYYTPDTVILRENKCINYEAPFVYLLFGQDRVLVQDTGAAPLQGSIFAFPIRETVQKTVNDWEQRHGNKRIQVIVTHSHAHRDHIAGDSQFTGQPNTVVVGTKLEEVRAFFGMRNWPNDQTTLDLGGRVVDLIAIPGHEASSIAIYDRHTKLLLTGDTLYPGRLYIRDWSLFKASIERLVLFVKSHNVSSVLGTHIEMSAKPGIDYPAQSTYQPDEHPLALKPAHVIELYQAVIKMKDDPVREVHNDFIIVP
jgi:hydroxyacylglutathione hydrolase